MIKSKWLERQIQHYVRLACRYELLAFDHNHSVEGDLAFHLMMRYRDKADALIRQVK
jgi:hypothetical protein